MVRAQNINQTWLIYCLFLVSIIHSLSGHGVAGETLVSILANNIKHASLTLAWMQIDQLQNCIHEQDTLVKTWSEQQLEFRKQSVCVTSTGNINCYMELLLLSSSYQTLCCAPDQLFYVLPPPNETDGGYEEAKFNFDNIELSNIKAHPNGTISGILPDGRYVNVRAKSEEGRATIEIINGTNNRIKIMY